MTLYFLGPLGKAELVSGGARVPATLAHAMEGAQAVLASAAGEAEDIRLAARAEGYAAGVAQGQAELAQVIAAAHMKAGRIAQEMQPLLADCAVQAIRMLIGDADPAALLTSAVERVRERLAAADGLLLTVSPALADSARDAAERLMEKYGATLAVRVAADPALAMSDWNIESSLGRAEVRQDRQLGQLRALIESALTTLEQE